MTEQVKTLSEWEVERQCVVISLDPKKKLTEAEFNAIPLEDRWGVDHTYRTKFLKDNGYAVTRENMINPELSTVPKKKK